MTKTSYNRFVRFEWFVVNSLLLFFSTGPFARGTIVVDNAVNLRYYKDEVIKVPLNTTYNIRINKYVREQADALYKNMGLSLSSAINLFLTQSVIQGKLPINEVIAEPAYTDILLRDAAKIDMEIANGTVKTYTTPQEMFKTWEDE